MLLGVGIDDRCSGGCGNRCRCRARSKVGRRDATADAGAGCTDGEVAADGASGKLAFVDQLEDVALNNATLGTGRFDLAQVDGVLLGGRLGARRDAGDGRGRRHYGGGNRRYGG